MTQANVMQAAALDEFGGPDAIRPHKLPLPEIESDELLIKVESAGIGVWDSFEREGEFAKMSGRKPRFPYVLGTDGAGTVVEVGQGVRGFKKGDRVYAYAFMNPKGGFYAQYVAVKAKDASPIPAGLTIEQAGALPADAITALCGLDEELGLKSGESVLIFGASGGIGHLAVQLAKRMGARVMAVASGEDGVALVRQLGADMAVDGHREDLPAAAREFAPKGLDAALLTAGGEAADKALSGLRDGGRVAYPNGVHPEPKVRAGIRATSYDGTPSPELLRKLNELIELGPFQVHLHRTFPLAQAAEAHRAMKGHFLGKMALRPN